LGVVRISLTRWFNNEFNLGTTHSDPCKGRDLLFSQRGDLDSSRGLNYSSSNEEASTFEESCTFNEEQLGEQEVEEDNKELQHDLKQDKLHLQNPYRTMVSSEYEVSSI
jgi:hypothetical protein